MGLPYMGSGSVAGQGKGVCTPKSFSRSRLFISAGKSGRCARQNSTYGLVNTLLAPSEEADSTAGLLLGLADTLPRRTSEGDAGSTVGAAEGAVDVDESGLRQHPSAQGDAVSAPGSTEAGTACGRGLGDCEWLEERPESVLHSRSESAARPLPVPRSESVRALPVPVLSDSPPDPDVRSEQLLDGGPGRNVGRPSPESSLSSEPVESLMDREADERGDGAVCALLRGRPGGSVARASVRDAGCWAGSFDTSARLCTTFSTAREGPFFKPRRFARRSARRSARRLARRCSWSAR